MKHRVRSRAAAALLAALAPACASAPEAPRSDDRETAAAPEAAPPAPARPWPRTFLVEGVLVGQRVRIEGPPGLRDHLALHQDPDHHRHGVQTTPEGLLQTTVVRDDVAYLAPIRCQLDRTTIVAERELVVLERPGDVPVTVEAEGDAYYKRTGSEEERRGPRLRIVGGAQ